jgi:predicted transcriptional regulator of viral defense system
VAILDIADLAGEQWGLVTTAQATVAGISGPTMSRLAREGVLQRLGHGVYKIAGSGYDPRDELRAAWLMLSPKQTASERLAQEPIDAVVSHRSAARLHELGDLEADLFEFTVTGRKQSRRRDVRIHVRKTSLPSDAWSLTGGLPVTTVITTIEDLAASHTDGGHLAGVVRDAIATAVVDLDRLSEVLRPYAHRYGAPLGDGQTLIRRFLAEAGLPRTTEQAMTLIQGPGWADSSIAKIADLARSNPALLQQLQQVSDPATLQMLELMSKPSTRRTLESVRQALQTIDPSRRHSDD